MSGFYKHPIRKWEKAGHRAEKWIKGHLALSIIALILGVLTLRGVVGAIQVGKPFSVKQIVISAVSQGFQTDKYGHTNILLLGVGGAGHDGTNLTDTMIVASVDHKNGRVPMLSIPRDVYVENDYLDWGTRLNSIYELVLDDSEDHETAITELEEEVEKVVGVDIHYYAMIDFEGLEDLVDAVGGVTINVDETISDDSYPGPDGSGIDFAPFYLSAGQQELDGETALKYVRSRKSTSDFDRSKRQQKLIAAVKDKALRVGFLLSPNKVRSVYNAVAANVKTNMSVTDMLNLANFASEMEDDAVLNQVINDAPNMPGGFLYTPEREAYGGAYVLVPYVGDFSEIHEFAQLYFYNSEVFQSKIPIQIVNGTKEEGLAGLTKMHLARNGFNVVAYGNAANESVDKTRIIPYGEEPSEYRDTLNLLPLLIPGNVLREVPEEYSFGDWESKAEIIIELGEDFADYYRDNRNKFYLGFY